MRTRIVVVIIVVAALGLVAMLPVDSDVEPIAPTETPHVVVTNQDVEFTPDASIDNAPVVVVEEAAAETLATIDAGVFEQVLEVEQLRLVDAGQTEVVLDARFGERWNKPGLCGDETYESLSARREKLLASFETVHRAGTIVHRDRSVPVAVANEVGHALDRARLITIKLLGSRADVAPPEVFVYASNQQLRDTACATSSAIVGYYDGAIHLPGDDADLVRTVIHEFMHHALNKLGIRKPMWLHEGMAMFAADERWWEDPRLGLLTWISTKHLPFPAMVEAFPHTADDLFAGAAYFQSYEMVRFVAQRSRQSDFAWLVDGLTSRTLSEQRCFEESIGLDGAELERAWIDFVTTR